MYITGDAAFAVDQRGRIVLWNEEAEKLLGYPAESALGQRCWNLLSGEDVFGNRYCCEFCPLREMAARHESMHGLQLSFRTAVDGRQNFALNNLLVFGDSGTEHLLHICHSAEELTEHPESTQPADRHAGTFQRRALTDRELEVLELLAEGKATHEIAAMMCISEATVRNHVQHMLNKLHVHNRLEAVVMGQRLELI
jgi:DNA-binding CsgD family transcriptional regulator